MNDDWDSVSSDIPVDSKTDDWDAVSTPDLAAAMQRRRRREQGQPIEEEERPFIAPVIPETDNLVTGEPLEQGAAAPAPLIVPMPPARTPEPEQLPALGLTARRNYTETIRLTSGEQEEPEEEIIEAPRRERKPRAARPPARRKGISAASIAIIVLCLAVIGLSVFSGFNIYQDVLIHNEKVRAAATVQIKATATEKADSTATVQALTTATAQTAATATVQTAATVIAQQQTYNQATSGTPAFNDPLIDDRNNWAVSSQPVGSCLFTGNAYHLIQFKANTSVFCTSGSVSTFNNFALQVQVSITRGDRGGVVFDALQNTFYQVVIGSLGDYFLLLYTQSGQQSAILKSGFNAAIIKGLNQPNIMTVIVNSGNLYLYVNNQFIINAPLKISGPETINLAAWDFSQHTDAAFNNLKIWKL